MQQFVYTLLCLTLLYFSPVSGDTLFGYLSYSTHNIGDDIQAIAAKRFLPENSLAINREQIGEFSYDSKVQTIMNGWFMWTKETWPWKDRLAPKKSWPPSSSIDPLLISMHFTESFISLALSEEGIKYLKQHGPVGARDYATLKELQKRDIPSYFSGCLTLTLENSYKEREPIIYAVDLDEECVKFIKSKTKHQVITINHNISDKMIDDPQMRLKYAEYVLERYQRAKCVITIRLHTAMPCLAFETPVLLINTQPDQYRFEGLKELVRNCSQEELLSDTVDFNFDEPTANSQLYIPIRENLIEIVTNWVKDHSNTSNTQKALLK